MPVSLIQPETAVVWRPARSSTRWTHIVREPCSSESNSSSDIGELCGSEEDTVWTTAREGGSLRVGNMTCSPEFHTCVTLATSSFCRFHASLQCEERKA